MENTVKIARCECCDDWFDEGEIGGECPNCGEDCEELLYEDEMPRSQWEKETAPRDAG